MGSSRADIPRRNGPQELPGADMPALAGREMPPTTASPLGRVHSRRRPPAVTVDRGGTSEMRSGSTESSVPTPFETAKMVLQNFIGDESTPNATRYNSAVILMRIEQINRGVYRSYINEATKGENGNAAARKKSADRLRLLEQQVMEAASRHDDERRSLPERQEADHDTSIRAARRESQMGSQSVADLLRGFASAGKRTREIYDGYLEAAQATSPSTGNPILDTAIWHDTAFSAYQRDLAGYRRSQIAIGDGNGTGK